MPAVLQGCDPPGARTIARIIPEVPVPDSQTPSEPARAHRFSVAIGALYALLGFGWILGSDALVRSVSTEPHWLMLAQRYKGLFYVVATTLGLVLLVRMGFRRLLAATAAARSSLERQEAQFRQLHQSLGEVLWLASLDGSTVLYVSPAFEQVYGRPAAEFRADPRLWLEMVHPDDLHLARESGAQLMSTGSSRCEYRICRPDGSLRWLSDRKRLIVDEHGRPTMIGGIAEDITAIKERDAARALTHAQLQQMVELRTAELERVNMELEAFTRTAAHDLKSPLNGIVGFSHLLQSRYGPSLGAEGTRMAGHIEQSARQMATLVNDLLALSRVTAAEVEMRPVDLAPMAREIISELSLLEPSRAVRFEVQPTLIACCDAGLARSLLVNLLGNAWKFTGRSETARIRMGGHVTDQGTVIEIEDNGAGFDSRHAENLFKPFQRFHSAREFSGTGIGLATCQRIVQRHGGRIWIDSTIGGGTTVRFLLAPEKLGVQADGTDTGLRAETARSDSAGGIAMSAATGTHPAGFEYKLSTSSAPSGSDTTFSACGSPGGSASQVPGPATTAAHP